MEIGKAIQQKKFENSYHKVIINILYTAGWLELEQTKLLRPFDISPQQYNVLRILRGCHPQAASVAYIQERMLDSMSNASRLVDKLLLKSLVLRQPCREDRRQVDIFITSQGLTLLEVIDSHMGTNESRYKKLSPEEAETLSGLLDKIRAV